SSTLVGWPIFRVLCEGSAIQCSALRLRLCERELAESPPRLFQGKSDHVGRGRRLIAEAARSSGSAVVAKEGRFVPARGRVPYSSRSLRGVGFEGLSFSILFLRYASLRAGLRQRGIVSVCFLTRR